MTKDLVIIILGVWVALVPFLGFPNQWDTIIFMLSGFAIVVFMSLLRRDLTHRLTNERQYGSNRRENSFVENGIRPGNSNSEVSMPHTRQVSVNTEKEVFNAKESKTENQ